MPEWFQMQALQLLVVDASKAWLGASNLRHQTLYDVDVLIPGKVTQKVQRPGPPFQNQHGGLPFKELVSMLSSIRHSHWSGTNGGPAAKAPRQHSYQARSAIRATHPCVEGRGCALTMVASLGTTVQSEADRFETAICYQKGWTCATKIIDLQLCSLLCYACKMMVLARLSHWRAMEIQVMLGTCPSYEFHNHEYQKGLIGQACLGCLGGPTFGVRHIGVSVPASGWGLPATALLLAAAPVQVGACQLALAGPLLPYCYGHHSILLPIHLSCSHFCCQYGWPFQSPNADLLTVNLLHNT